MNQKRSLLALSLLSALLSVVAAASDKTTTTSNGIQTNFGDLSFAGGMSYDAQHETIYVTGQVSSHSCFVGVLKRIEGAETSPTKLELLSKQVFDEKAICQTIAFRKDVSRPGNALLLSLSEEGGLLTDRREEGSQKAVHYGGLLDLQYSSDGSSSKYSPDQSVLLYQTAPVTIPRSITNDPKRTNRVFVATMTSDSMGIEYRSALGSPHENDGVGLTVTPNLTPSGGLLKYGNNFAMTVESIRLATEFSSAQPQWRKPFGVRRNADSAKQGGVTVNQILCSQRSIDEDKKNKDSSELFVVGSAFGSSPAFGQPELENDNVDILIAGFITKLHSDSGNLLLARRFVFDPNKNIPLTDTHIEAVCEGNKDEDAIYVVGSYGGVPSNPQDLRSLQTEETDLAVDDDIVAGDDSVNADEDDDDDDSAADDVVAVDDNYDGEDEDDDDDDSAELDDLSQEEDDDDDDDRFPDDNGVEGIGEDKTPDAVKGPTIATPFVAKLRASSLETIWQQDFESTSDARALACGMDVETKALYVAGIVEDGGELIGRTKSLLGDDVFLMRLDPTDGSVSWAKQLGTSEDDRLAYGGSGLVVLEGQKGVLLMGDTTGNLFSNSNADSEIFIMEVNADGDLPQLTEVTGVDYSSSASSMKLSNPVNTEGGGKVADDKAGKKNTQSKNASKHDFDGKGSDGSIGGMFYMLISAGIAITAIGSVCFAVSQKKQRAATERALVFSYLQHFDLEDIDVKQAATGGWHGTYVGRLAQGVNVLENGSDSSSDGFRDGTYSDEIYDVKRTPSVERRLSNLSHSSVVRDILFMDCDESVYKDNSEDDNAKKNKKKKGGKVGAVRDPSAYSDDGGKEEDDPWGRDII